MKSSTTTINVRNRMSVPKTVCDALGVGPGDRLHDVINGDMVQLFALDTVWWLSGMLKHKGPPLSLERPWITASPMGRPENDRGRHQKMLLRFPVADDQNQAEAAWHFLESMSNDRPVTSAGK